MTTGSVSQEDEAFTGYKAAYITCRAGDTGRIEKARFVAALWPTPYQSNSYATCRYGHSHEPPYRGCSCGFYALRDKDRILVGRFKGGAALERGGALMKVRFSGDVVEGRDGWQGGRQHVESVWVNPVCAESGCSSDAVVLLLGEPIVREVGKRPRTATGEYSPPESREEWACWKRVESRCLAHRGDGETLGFNELSGMLGCDVLIGSRSEWERPAWKRWAGRGLNTERGSLVKPPRGARRISVGISVMMSALWIVALVGVLTWARLAEEADRVGISVAVAAAAVAIAVHGSFLARETRLTKMHVFSIAGVVVALLWAGTVIVASSGQARQPIELWLQTGPW